MVVPVLDESIGEARETSSLARPSIDDPHRTIAGAVTPPISRVGFPRLGNSPSLFDPANAGRVIVEARENRNLISGLVGSVIETREYDRNGYITQYVVDDDFDGDGKFTRGSSMITYGRPGQALLVVNEGGDADGTIWGRSIQTALYDTRGNLLELVLESDGLADGAIEDRYSTTQTFDSRGNAILIVLERSHPAEGTVEYRRTTMNEFDTRGDLERSVHEVDNSADGTIEFSNSTEFVRDPKGNPIGEVFEISGSQDVRLTYEREFDAHSNILVERSYGQRPDGSIASRASTTNEYDAQGRHVRRLHEFDRNADGGIDFRSWFTLAYDPRGNTTQERFEEDYDGDGPLLIGTRSTTLRAFDSRSHLLNEISEIDGDGDYGEAIYWRWTTACEYGARGDRVSCRYASDPGGDGTLESLADEIRDYDSQGELISIVLEYDWAGDGVIEERVNTTYDYSGSGSPPRPGP